MNFSDIDPCIINLQFQEMGYLPAAMVNYLALLGWNDGSEEEIFTVKQLSRWHHFSLFYMSVILLKGFNFFHFIHVSHELFRDPLW